MHPRSLQPIIVLAAASLAFGGKPPDLPDYSDLSLDQLANVKITSFTKKQQNLSQVAGAVYVITQEQIVRSGLTSVPELLRLVPGVDVAQVNGNQWAIGVRGTVGVYSNKLLVLIDGRSIYSPVFSGVYWDVGMPLLDEIERIEVIRGPGATIWGANAVLGVINIITKSARDAHGITITSGGGNMERGLGSVSMGGALGSTSYRGFFGGADNAPLSQASLNQTPGANAGDGWSSIQGGFRLDGSRGKNSWMLGGDLFRGAENEIGVGPVLAAQRVVESPSQFDTLAGSLNGEWRRRFGDKDELRLSSWYDYTDRPEPQASKVVSRTWDTSVQYDFTAGRHVLSAGAGARLIDVNISPGEVTFSPADLLYANFNAFAQDEMHFAHDSLLFTVGAKLERNHFGGWGSDPSANLLWMPEKRHSLWISAARSLRTPSLFEIAVDAPFTVVPASAATGGLPVVGAFAGSPAFASESVKDFEGGYRGQLSKAFSVDLTAFSDRYSKIRSFVIGNPVLAFAPAPYLLSTAYTANGTAETGKGAEASLAWQVLPDWKIEGTYTYTLIDWWLSGSAAPGSVYADEKQPSRNKWRLQSYVNLSRSWKLDTYLYYTSEASPVTTVGSPQVFVPAYTRLDVRLGYKAGRHWQLSLAGQNLLQARHLEGTTELLTAYSYVKRGVYLKSIWQF